MLHKHSTRTRRQPCDRCGSTSLYWFHDSDRPTGVPCKDCGHDGRMVLVEKDTDADGNLVLHSAVCGVKPSPKDIPAKTPVPAPLAPRETPKEPAKVSETTDDTALALAEMLAKLANSGPQVDAEMVREMVEQQFQSVVFPTRTVVQMETGEVKAIGSGITHSKLADVIMDIQSGEHVLMVGPAGTGKSTIAEQAAEGLGLRFFSMSLSPTMPLSHIVGYKDGNGEYHRTDFREAFENGGLFLFDEMDAGHPGILVVMNAALANGVMSFPDGMIRRHKDFKVIASANTYGNGADRKYVGRNQLDGATLDRFTIEYIPVDEALEQAACELTGLEHGQIIKVLEYVRRLRSAAQRHSMAVIISPRASIGMCRLLKAGRSWDDAVAVRLNRGMSASDWAKLH